jgi:hypothetical protein
VFLSSTSGGGNQVGGLAYWNHANRLHLKKPFDLELFQFYSSKSESLSLRIPNGNFKSGGRFVRSEEFTFYIKGHYLTVLEAKRHTFLTATARALCRNNFGCMATARLWNYCNSRCSKPAALFWALMSDSPPGIII